MILRLYAQSKAAFNSNLNVLNYLYIILMNFCFFFVSPLARAFTYIPMAKPTIPICPPPYKVQQRII